MTNMFLHVDLSSNPAHCAWNGMTNVFGHVGLSSFIWILPFKIENFFFSCFRSTFYNDCTKESEESRFPWRQRQRKTDRDGDTRQRQIQIDRDGDTDGDRKTDTD